MEPKPTFKAELRVEGAAEKRKIVGYAAVFNSLSEDLGGFNEQIAPGAFKKAIRSSDARALWNHDPNYVLGRQSSGTLKLREDKKGLWMEITPPKTTFARDLMHLIERGDIDQQSFGFTIKREKWEFDEDEEKPALRTLVEIDRLYDVSPVTYPAYQETSVALRMLDAAREKHESQEDHGQSAEVESVQSDSNIGRNYEALKKRANKILKREG